MLRRHRGLAGALLVLLGHVAGPHLAAAVPAPSGTEIAHAPAPGAAVMLSSIRGATAEASDPNGLSGRVLVPSATAVSPTCPRGRTALRRVAVLSTRGARQHPLPRSGCGADDPDPY